jgi:tetratricopeptide (TPR) repeat protein
VQELSDYETTYFFVVLFVPLIPLGKKQVFADCPRCRRHRVMPLAEWQRIEEQSLSQGAKSLGENPDDPHTALELLRSFSAFQRYEEAEKLATGMQTQYDDHAEVQTAIGHWHEYRNRPGEAAQCFRQAHQLEPGNLAAKCGVVRSLLREGNTGAAQALVDSAPPVPAASDVSLFIDLGRAHQREGNHPAALTAFWAALEAAPKLREDSGFRKLVRTSEKQVPGQPSMLRGWSPGGRWLAIGGSVAALFLGVMAYLNYHIATHRELHVVNGFEVPLAVQLDQRQPLTVKPHERTVVAMTEGVHHALVTHDGKKLIDEPFEMGTDYLSRWFSSPVFVYNAAGGAPLAWEETTYAVNPVDEGAATVALRPGLVQYDDVDFVFEEFPATIKLEGGKSVKRSRVTIVTIRPEQIVLLPAEMATAEDKLAYLERHLRTDPDSKLLVQTYVNAAALEQQLDRAKKFLAAGLDEHPLRIEWHRMADRLNDTPAESDALRERYRRLIERDPKNARAMYLLGRLEPTEKSQKLFEQAIEIDPESPYPWQALGYLQRTMGDFAAAKASYERAAELNPEDLELEEIVLDLKFALKEYSLIEEEVRADLNQDRTRLDRHLRLLEVLVAQGRTREASQENDKYMALAQATPDEFLPQAVGTARAMMHYLEQDYEALLKDADEFAEDGGVERLRFQAQLELGRLEAAGENLLSIGGDGFELLELAIGCRAKGDEVSAQKWWDLALEQFDQGDDGTRHAAELLRKADEVQWGEVRPVQIEPSEKTILLIALAQRQPPEKRAELLTPAESFNYNFGANHWFRARAINVLGKASQK